MFLHNVVFKNYFGGNREGFTTSFLKGNICVFVCICVIFRTQMNNKLLQARVSLVTFHTNEIFWKHLIMRFSYMINHRFFAEKLILSANVTLVIESSI